MVDQKNLNLKIKNVKSLYFCPGKKVRCFSCTNVTHLRNCDRIQECQYEQVLYKPNCKRHAAYLDPGLLQFVRVLRVKVDLKSQGRKIEYMKCYKIFEVKEMNSFI